jgi:hypothetical protein
MANLDQIMNWGIPTLLLLIAIGFIWTKFLQPWVFPMFAKMWEWIKNSQEPTHNTSNRKEIAYE